MKRKLYRLLCSVMVIGLLTGMPAAAFASSESIASGVDEASVIVCAADTVDAGYEDLGEVETPNYYSVGEILTEKSKIVEVIHGKLLACADKIEIKVKLDHNPDSAEVDSWFDAAMVETKKGNEGDYLRGNVASRGGGSSFYQDAGFYYITYTFTVKYRTDADQEEAISDKIDSVLEDLNIDAMTNDYDKVKAIYGWVTENVSYDKDNYLDPTYKPMFTAHAALFDGKAVCDGFSKLLYRMLKEAGLSARIMTSAGHAWNIVKLGTKYYELDSTWDEGNEEEDWAFFLLGSDNITKYDSGDEHQPDAAHSGAAFEAACPISKTDYDPKTDAYTVSADADADELAPGEHVQISVKVDGADFEGAEAILTYDADTFTFNLTESSAITGATIQANGTDEVIVQFKSDTASVGGTVLATLDFVVNSGIGPATKDFTIKTAKVGNIADTYEGDWSAAATEKTTVTIKLPVASTTIEDYIDGYTLVLVKGEAGSYYYYDGNAFYADSYTIGDDVYTLAYLVDGKADMDKITSATTGTAPVKIATGNDVNANEKISYEDAVAAFGVEKKVGTPSMEVQLRADVDRDGHVNATDISKILTEIKY